MVYQNLICNRNANKINPQLPPKITIYNFPSPSVVGIIILIYILDNSKLDISIKIYFLINILEANM